MTARIPLNDLSRISRSEVEEISAAISAVISSGQLLHGPHTSLLQQEMSSIFGDRSVVPVSNGTDALTLALLSLGLPLECKVAVAPNAGGYATTAARRIGLRTTFVDVDPATAQMDPVDLDNLLETDPSIAAVIVTHLYGLCGDIENISAICRKRGLPLIEDCAQSIGSRVLDIPAGTFGDLATLSFYPTKNLGAIGDAGAVVCRTPEITARVRTLAQYGWSERYTIAHDHGFNSRIDEVQAAVLRIRLRDLEARNSRRREIIKLYSDSSRGTRRFVFSDSERFVGHLAVMITDTRDIDREHLDRLGVDTSIHYPFLDQNQPAWHDPSARLTPVADRLSRQILSLPCFPEMTTAEIATVCQALKEL